MDLCPNTFCKVSNGIPFKMARTAKVWRPMCGVIPVEQPHILVRTLRLDIMAWYSPTGNTCTTVRDSVHHIQR